MKDAPLARENTREVYLCGIATWGVSTTCINNVQSSSVADDCQKLQTHTVPLKQRALPFCV